MELLEPRLAPAAVPLSLADPALYGSTANDRSSFPSLSGDGEIVAFQSAATNLLPGVNTAGQIYALNRSTNALSLVSVASDDASPADAVAIKPVVSADGRYVLFTSPATNLVDQDLIGGVNLDQLYLRDLQVGTTTLISVTPDGTAGGNDDSGGDSDRNSREGPTNPPSLYAISANGRYVAFWSTATNLVADAPAAPHQLYLRDLQAGTTRLVSVDTNGRPAEAPPDRVFIFATIPYLSLLVSNDGLVAFEAANNNLVPGDTDDSFDLFIHTTTTERIRLPNSTSRAPQLTPDGQHLAFVSQVIASSTVPQVYVLNLQTRVATLVTIDPDQPDQPVPNGVSRFSMSQDGQKFAYQNNRSGDNVFHRDLAAGVTLVSHGPGGTPANGASREPVISGDGSTVVFRSAATNLVTDFVNNNGVFDDFYVFDRGTGGIRLLSADYTNPVAGGNGSSSTPTPVLSSDGGVIVFQNPSTNLIAGDNNRFPDVFLSAAGQTQALSRRDPTLPQAFTADGNTTVVGASADGRLVLLFTDSSNLTPTPGQFHLRDTETGEFVLSDVFGGSIGMITPDGRFVTWSDGAGAFLYDRVNQTNERINVTPTGDPSNESAAISAVSDDGRYVAFHSTAADLVDGFIDGNPGQGGEGYGTGPDLYLRDRQFGTTVLVNRAAGTTTTSGNVGVYAAAAIRGGVVLFQTEASDHVPGDANGPFGNDAFAFDIATETLALVSANAAGTGSGDAGIEYGSATAAAGGRYVVFASSATDLVPGVTGTHVYRRDLQSGTTALVDVAHTGGAANGTASNPWVSGDGRWVVFQSDATDLIAGFTPTPGTHVYARDLTDGLTVLVSGGNGPSQLAAVSPDGRYVVVESVATDLVGGFVDGNGASEPDLFHHDMQTGITRLVSQNLAGTASGDRGTFGFGTTIALADGRVLFTSPAANLINAVDGNGSNDAFLATPLAAVGGTIRGVVFNDADGDGSRDAGEAGLGDVRVFLDANADGVFQPEEASVFSNAEGSFALVGVPLGVHRLTVVVGANLQLTTPAAGFHVVTIDANEQVIDGQDFGARVRRPDLVIDAVTAPGDAAPGRLLTVSWSVRNSGNEPAAGPWHDAVYLSRRPTLGPDAILLGTATHQGGLVPGGSYAATGSFVVPALLPGTYYAIVQADRRFRVAGDPRANNVAASAGVPLDVPELTLGVPAAGRFTAAEADRYYRVTVPAGAGLALAVDGMAGATHAVFARFESLAGLVDGRSGQAGADPSLSIPVALPGTYFVLVRHLDGAPGAFTLTATLPGLTLLSAQPGRVGNAGQATLTVRGTCLRADTAYQLLGPGGPRAGVTARYVDAGLAYVTFDLTGAEPGAYPLRATNPGGETATLAAGVDVVAAAGAGVDVRLLGPSRVREGRTAAFQVEYVNSGDSDAVAPLLALVAPSDSRFSLTRDGLPGTSGFQFLGVSPTGPAGVLPPGARVVVPVYFTGPEAGTRFEFEVRVITGDDPEPIDWDVLIQSIDPAVRAAPNFREILAALRGRVGDTRGEYVSALARNATLLPAVVGDNRDPVALLNLEVRKVVAALGTSLSGTLTTASAGVAVAGRTVTARERTTGEGVTTTTLTDGSFLFERLPPGTYALRVNGGLIGGANPEVTVDAGQAVEGVTVTLVPGATLFGRLTAAGSNAPLGNAAIALMSGFTPVGGAVTDDSGFYSFPSVPFGTYTALVVGSGQARTTLPVVIDEAAERLDLAMAPAAAALGTVTLADGAAVTEVTVAAIRRGDGLFPSYTFTSKRPAFAIGQLPAGTYDIVLLHAGYDFGFLEGVEVGEGEVVDLGAIELPLLPNGPLDGGAGFSPLPPGLIAALSVLEQVAKAFAFASLQKDNDFTANLDGLNIGELYFESLTPNPVLQIGGRVFRDHNKTREALKLTLLAIRDKIGTVQAVQDALATLTSCDAESVELTLELADIMEEAGLEGDLIVTTASPPEAQARWNSYRVDNTALPGIVAGGVGEGNQPPFFPPVPRVLDTREVTGQVKLTINADGKGTIEGDFDVHIIDTFDFAPGGIGPLEDSIFLPGDKLLGTRAVGSDFTTAGGVMGLGLLEFFSYAFDVTFQLDFHFDDPIQYPVRFDLDHSEDCDDEEYDDRLDGESFDSYDPNEIVGPGGFGEERFLRAGGTLPYTVYFENDPERATAPAQEVFVTHQLDPDLDWSTFALGRFGFGPLTLDVPAGLQEYQAEVGFQNQDGSPLRVDVRATLDRRTGTVTWAFRSVDPETGALPEDVLAGFLPVNDATGRGEGFVSFSVRHKSGLPTDTRLDAVASIVFDTNDAIVTNTHINTIDRDGPTSAVQPLPATSPATFTVRWAGGDAGSGVASYDVYVSDNGGPFTLFLDDTTATQASFTGQPGHTYRFYSVATDNVGYTELAPLNPDTFTTVVVITPPGITLQPDPVDPTRQAVVVTGTDAADTLVVLSPRPATARLIFNGVASDWANVSRVIAHGGGGDDALTAMTSFLPVWLFGDDGNDTLFGGFANDLLVGGAGADALYGLGGNDILIGGTGADAVFGGGGEDIVIGGRTAFDADANALAAIQREWNASRGLAERLANLRGDAHPRFGERLNGDVFLRPAETVFDDDAVDFLDGGAGSDWVFALLDGPAADVFRLGGDDWLDRLR